jgi:hypothetical protein
VIITHRNKPRLVLLSIEDYRRPAAGADTRGTLETMPDTLFEDLKEAVSAYERDLRYSLSLSLGAGSRAWRDGGPEGSSGGRGVRIWLVLLPITSQPLHRIVLPLKKWKSVAPVSTPRFAFG